MKREIIIIGVLILIIIILVLGMKLTTIIVERSDAAKFVLEDLRARFPDADKIEILSMEQHTNEKGEQYYLIKARVSDNLTTPCPTRVHYYYNYPQQNFVPAPPEYIVKDCKVCERTPCVIAFEEEAIVASHTLPGTEEVNSYIANAGALPTVKRKNGRWEVLWSSPLPYSYYSYLVVVADNGTVISVERK